MPMMPGVTFVGPIPSSNFATSGGGKIGACVHVIVGSASSALGEFRGQSAQLSSHFIVAGPNDGWPDGTILQVIDTDLNCYAQGDGNYPPIAYIAIEVAGTPDTPMTAAQLGSVAAICSWSARTHGFPIVGPTEHGTPGITTHCHPNGDADPAWGNHPCPGPIRLAQVPQIVALATGPKPPPTEVNMGISQAFSAVPGQLDVFSTGMGKLWHKWRIGETWGNEDVGAKSGGGAAASFPDQDPKWSVVGGHLYVTVQDSTTNDWLFDQAIGTGAWGVAKLP